MSIETLPRPDQDIAATSMAALPAYQGRHEAAMPVDSISGESDITDLVTIDSRERGHRPDGKFMSAREVGKVALFADEIRAGRPGRHESRSESMAEAPSALSQEQDELLANPGTAFSVEGKLPALDENEQVPGKLAKVRSFFARRTEQIRRVVGVANTAAQHVYARNIAGVDMSAGTMWRARVQPANVAHNLRRLAANLQQVPEGERYDHAIDNPVIRHKMYEAASNGSEQAKHYLAKNDPNFGKYESSTIDVVKEAAAIFSGAAAAHRIGVNAIKFTLLGKEILAKDPDKRQELSDKFDKVTEAHRHMYGSRQAEKKRAMYDLVAQKPRDPFEDLN